MSDDQRAVMRWSEIARSLEVPYHQIKKVRLDLLVGKLEYPDAFYEILSCWVSNRGVDATLGELCWVLELHQLKSCAGIVYNLNPKK